jgi:hypothetical protein
MEILIRKIGVFGNFLRMAAEMSGNILSFREISITGEITMALS